MPLSSSDFSGFMETLSRASEELHTLELVFRSEWFFDLPGQVLEMGGIRLNDRYDIPTGWNGYSLDDLMKLVEMGFLRISFDSGEDAETFERTIKFEIKKAV